MKIMVPLMILIMLACANLAFSQAAPSYSPAQAQPIYGSPQPQPVYGAPQAQLTYGPQQPGPAYGAPQAQQYGPAPVQSYGSQQAQSSLYDTSYNGLFNMYGQPTFLAPQYPAGARQQAQQQQQGQDGLIFRGAAALESAGSYLWGYMPAPLRGADKGYFGAAGNGPTIINFVPGAP